MSRMPSCPNEFYRMLFEHRHKALPEIDIEHRFFIRFFPAALDPIGKPPFFDRLHDILRIGVQLHIARSFQRFQADDNGAKFHAVICRPEKPFGEFALVALLVAQDNAVTAGTGIPGAGAIGKDRYVGTRRVV